MKTTSQRVNVYLDPKHYELWLKIPAMRRSRWVQKKLREDAQSS